MERSHGVQRGQILVGEDFFKMFNGELVLEVEHMVDKEVEDMVDMVDMVDMSIYEEWLRVLLLANTVFSLFPEHG